mmetsp:Transcript_14535/g.14144  ORF Transcript_14535/g.14144 Transcript_14535/m.14144 type:complete len:100 (-) Transcript_14535:1-300(-)
MYVVSSKGILVFKSIEKKDEQAPVSDEQNLLFTPNCIDCDHRGFLLVDTMKENQENPDNQIKRYYFRELKHAQPLEGTKDLIRFFKDHVVEVRTVKNGS